MENPSKSLKHLEELESLAQDILSDRQAIVALDKRRQEDREGLRALSNSKEDKAWVTLGPLLVKFPKKKAEDILKKGEKKKLNY